MENRLIQIDKKLDALKAEMEKVKHAVFSIEERVELMAIGTDIDDTLLDDDDERD